MKIQAQEGEPELNMEAEIAVIHLQAKEHQRWLQQAEARKEVWDQPFPGDCRGSISLSTL